MTRLCALFASNNNNKDNSNSNSNYNGCVQPMDNERQCPTTHKIAKNRTTHTTQERTNPGPAGPWQWHMGLPYISSTSGSNMAAVCVSAWAAWLHGPPGSPTAQQGRL